jgi:hypothetical protein
MSHTAGFLVGPAGEKIMKLPDEHPIATIQGNLVINWRN